MTEFSPDVSDLYTEAGLFTLIFLAGCVGAWWFGRSGAGGDARQKTVLPMLLFFGGLLGLVGLAGTTLTYLKYPVVGIGDTQISIDGEMHKFPRPNDLRMETVNGGLSGPGRILLMRVPADKTYALPDDRYDLTAILRHLKKE